VELVNAGDVQKAVQLSGQEFKGNTLTVAVSQKKSQPETPGKKQEKSGKTAKAGVQQHTDKGRLNVCYTTVSSGISEC